MTMNTKDEIILKLKKYFHDKKDVQMAFLFGSIISGRHATDSDVDIAVYLTNDEVSRIWGEVETLLHANVDLIVLNDAKPAIAWSAICGERISIKDEKLFLDYYLKTSSEAEDFCDYIIDFWNWRKKIRGEKAA